jgi:membrane protein DedA with SNARE-associated domain
MGLTSLLQQYGYAAVFLGTLVEGESILLLGGFAAHRGYLHLTWVIAVAFSAAAISDQLYFHLSRRHGARVLARRPKLYARVQAALHLVERHGTWIVLLMRFMWGLRIALPVAMGMSEMNAKRYLILDLFAAAAWALIFSTIGFFGTHFLAQWVDDLRRHEVSIVVGLIVLAVVVLAWRWWPTAPSVSAPGQTS